MKERPILFSAPMVRAILEGRKTQTRRMVKPQPYIANTAADGMRCWNVSGAVGGRIMLEPDFFARCPYGQPGDRLWVRETWKTHSTFDHLAPRDVPPSNVFYAAGPKVYSPSDSRWRPSIHMPRWASRITLEVTGVRVERLQDISEADAIAEGILRDGEGWRGAYGLPWCASPVGAFRSLWESINGVCSWDDHPSVWVVEFHRIEQEAKAA